jgi:putative ABC transport system substrate-binding protein
LAAELVRLSVDVLVTGGGESARAAKEATATIPIVMATGADPVRQGIATRPIGVAGPSDLDRAFSAAAKEHAVIVIASPPLFTERKRIADLALKHRLASMVGGREYAEAGGLVSYAVNYLDLFRRAALYVDKILKGAKPADLPVEQPTTFDLVINLKTAKTLGLNIPRALLVRADRVIE